MATVSIMLIHIVMKYIHTLETYYCLLYIIPFTSIIYNLAEQSWLFIYPRPTIVTYDFGKKIFNKK